MTKTYLAYATSGKEFDVEAELLARDIDVWCGRIISFRRTGKNRRAEAIEAPKLPNYIFLTITDEEWHDIQKEPVKHLAKHMYTLRRDDVAELQRFQKLVNADHQEGQKIAKRNDIAEMAQFEKGQKLIDLRGRFGEQAITFKRIVERSKGHPEIEAETEMMGRVVTMYLDPLDVTS